MNYHYSPQYKSRVSLPDSKTRQGIRCKKSNAVWFHLHEFQAHVKLDKTEVVVAAGWTMTGKEHRATGLWLDLGGAYLGRSIGKNALICTGKICVLYANLNFKKFKRH